MTAGPLRAHLKITSQYSLPTDYFGRWRSNVPTLKRPNRLRGGSFLWGTALYFKQIDTTKNNEELDDVGSDCFSRGTCGDQNRIRQQQRSQADRTVACNPPQRLIYDKTAGSRWSITQRFKRCLIIERSIIIRWKYHDYLYDSDVILG